MTRISTLVLALILPLFAWAEQPTGDKPPGAPPVFEPLALPRIVGSVQCANLVYGNDKSSVCFSGNFLKQLAVDTHITADPNLVRVKLESPDLFEYPFAIMTGEGDFTLTPVQRENMRNYLIHGGFIVASAGCSSQPWARSFRREVQQVFTDTPLKELEFTHPIFHTVHDIGRLDCKKGGREAHLEGLEVDGKIVLIFSEDGLNETSKAGGNCCCCGGNEIRNAGQMNANLLAYTLTH